MCFCLRQANRLIPNRFSFPLVDRSPQRRGNFDLGTEEEGLLSHYSDVEDEDDAEVIPDQTVLNSNRFEEEEDMEEELQDYTGRSRETVTREEEEEFGTLQQHHQKTRTAKDSYLVGGYTEESEEEENELYRNPYKDDV